MTSIIIKNLQKKIPVNNSKVKKIVLKIISREALPGRGQVNIAFISDSRIKRLNSRFHGRDIPTDVLAFGLGRPKKELIADIYISADTALRNSRVFKTSPGREMYLYVIHAMLHLSGYGDHRPGDIKKMRGKEQEYLKWL